MILYVYLSFFVSYSISSVLCYIEDINNTKKKIQGYNYEEIVKKYKYCMPLILLNTFVSMPIILCITQPFFWLLRPFEYYHILHLPVSLFMVDFTFYGFHYLFHSKYLYRFHKVHHRIKNPIGMSSIYLHPIDLLFGNILPLFMPVFLMRSSFEILYIWTIFTVFNTTYYGHSGVEGRAEGHDMHHKEFRYNYGSGMYLSDKILGTYKN